MTDKTLLFDQLLAYAAGECSKQEATEIEANLVVSPELSEKVNRLRSAVETMRDDDTEVAPAESVAKAKALFRVPEGEQENWWKRVEAIVASIIFDSRTQPAVAGLRGQREGFAISCKTESVEIDLEAEPITDSREVNWRLIGQISSLDAQTPTGTSIPVALLDSNSRQHLAETAADAHGVFTLDTPPGRYEVLIRAHHQVVSLPIIEIE